MPFTLALTYDKLIIAGFFDNAIGKIESIEMINEKKNDDR